MATRSIYNIIIKCSTLPIVIFSRSISSSAMAGMALEMWCRKWGGVDIGDDVNEEDVEKLKWNRSRIALWGVNDELEFDMVILEAGKKKKYAYNLCFFDQPLWCPSVSWLEQSVLITYYCSLQSRVQETFGLDLVEQTFVMIFPSSSLYLDYWFF